MYFVVNHKDGKISRCCECILDQGANALYVITTLGIGKPLNSFKKIYGAFFINSHINYYLFNNES